PEHIASLARKPTLMITDLLIENKEGFSAAIFQRSLFSDGMDMDGTCICLEGIDRRKALQCPFIAVCDSAVLTEDAELWAAPADGTGVIRWQFKPDRRTLVR